MHTQTVDISWWYPAFNDGYPAMPVAAQVRGTLPVGDNESPADGEANVCFRLEASLAASASMTISLFEIQNAGGATVELTEIHGLFCTVETAGGKGKIEKGASDPWTALGATPVIPFDSAFPLFLGSTAGFAVSNTDKNVKVTNTGASTSTFVLYVLGRA